MAVMREWRWSALEFRVLWESTGRDVLPYPLRHRPSELIREDYDRTRREAAKRLVAQWDDDLVQAVLVLLEPEVRVEVAGMLGPRKDGRLRLHAARRAEYGALAVQEPGRDPEEAGDVRLSLFAADLLAPAVVRQLPKCARGQGKPIQIPVAELDDPLPVARDHWRPTPREEFETFLRRPSTATIHVAVYPFGSVDNRHTEGRKDFQLTDVENDGRYVTFGTHTVYIKPTESPRVTRTLSDMITATLREVHTGDHAPR
ncbi:ESX secretion-associated protein EspG [Nocardia sp. NPDC127579]|uniref:ESX secretion-associated protein EspG n=1 Tax=Nocardia sp. NPDC127579 TaxID=3345402 RepID=UPI0036355D1D